MRVGRVIGRLNTCQDPVTPVHGITLAKSDTQSECPTFNSDSWYYNNMTIGYLGITLTFHSPLN